MLPPLQRKKMERLFHFWDLHQNGALEKADYEAIVQRIANERGWEKGDIEYASTYNAVMTNWAQVEHFADTDADKHISLEEWLAYCDHILQDATAYRLHAMELMMTLLNAVDTDGDGKITLEDYQMWFRIFGNDEAEAEAAFHKIDADDSGEITIEELISAVDDFYHSNAEGAAGNHMFGVLT